ncbi:MAG: hypothetical protein F4107_08205 [Gemmatimonadetes bacterium]|nr:hypothetical protein [Gemmatimonadota bacterium]MYD13903.1 hypothetical protein [Gemmatimonadota bacterium]MYI65901.1 hypothetical protein [Gemmatimonadota bacterium]
MNSFTRWWEVTRRECRAGLRQPVFWLVLALLAIIAWTDSGDAVHLYNSEIASTGIWPFNTSVVSQALRQGGILMMIAPWSLAMTLGLVVIRDLELRVVEVFNSTRLTPGEYVWGKFSGVTGFFLLVWGLYLVLAMGFDHIVQGSGGHYLIGPFALRNYLVPTVLVGLPQILFYAGVSLFIGTWTRRPVVVFLFPVVMLLYRFTPWWGLMPQSISETVALLDPIGVFWVDDTYVVGRTTEQVNTAALIPDAVFLLSRLAWAGLGLAGVAGAAVIYARQVQTGVSGRGLRSAGGLIGFLRGPRAAAARIRPQAEPTLADLQMTTRPLGFRGAAGAIARSEIRDLLVRPGMYLCVPLILWIAMARASVIDSLLTSGISASRQYTELGMFLCLLLLFYTVESLHRERGRRMHEIFGSAPVPTGAILFGKALGNSVMAAFILVVVLLASAGVIVHRQIAHGSPVGFELWPFVAVWGGVLLPTFVFWTALITALFALFRNRYVVYGAGMAVFILTLRIPIDERFKSWSTNWMGLDVISWSDMGTFAPHGYPLLLNRLLYLSLVPLLIALSVRWFRRRDLDATGLAGRLSPRPLLRDAARVLPLAVPPIVLASMLVVGGRSGYQGPAAEEWEKDYWIRNVATWEDFRMPSVSHVDLDLDIEPAERSVAVDGAYTFRNHRDYAYDRLPLTAGPWEPIEWTLGGEPYEPENRDGLYVFTPGEPLESGDTITIGFRYRVVVLGGISRTPQPVAKFVLESGVNIDGFEPVFAPVPGYRPAIGSEYHDPPEYRDDFHEGRTEPVTLWAGPGFTARTRITMPEEYTALGVGDLVSEERSGGRRTVVWETGHPVAMFNVVAGRYAVREGEGTAIYYHPGHDYNIEEMALALDAARRYYAEWFHPFPWSVLKLSEYPGYLGGAQGFPTNIVISESEGFLDRSEPGSRGPFAIVAHEAAHNWWGALLTPGEGPGGDALLSEGMANYATMLLFEQVYGDRERMAFSRLRERDHVRFYRPGFSLPPVRTTGGDYHRGPWIMWMLQHEMGRENLLSGLRAFIEEYKAGPDYPVIQDMLAVLRDFAPDTAAFDAFAEQWFFGSVLPEYRFSDVTKVQDEDEWVVRGTLENVGTGRMRVQVGAVAGERWSHEVEDAGRSVVAGGYRDARTEVVLGAGESAGFEIRAAFEPERVVVDPDVMVLQLRRRDAAFEF